MVLLFIMLFINTLKSLKMEIKKVQVLKTVYLRSSNSWKYETESLTTFTLSEYLQFVSKGTVSWFRRLGSRQVLKKQHTSFGHLVTQLSSYSPDNTEKHVYNFRFIY